MIFDCNFESTAKRSLITKDNVLKGLRMKAFLSCSFVAFVFGWFLQ